MSEPESRHFLGSGETLPDAREALAWASETRVRTGAPADYELFEDAGWIDRKREHEVGVVRLRPHPAEFALDFDS